MNQEKKVVHRITETWAINCVKAALINTFVLAFCNGSHDNVYVKGVNLSNEPTEN